MSTREIIVSMLDSLTEEQLQGLMMLLKGYVKKQEEIEVDSVRGILSKYANPDLVPLEKEAWERTVVKNYENA